MQGLTRYVLALCLLSVPAFGADNQENPDWYVTENDRLWVNFGRESAVVGSGNLRVGVQAMAINYGVNDRTPDFTGFPVNDLEQALEIAGTPDKVKGVEGTRMDVVGAIGLGPTIEFGFDVPVFVERIFFEGNTPDINTSDVGDLLIHAKFRKMVSNNLAVGGGLEISTPTGSEKKRLGTGELGFNPFINARYTSGGFAVGGHLGFQMFENDVKDVLNYGAFLIARRDAHLAFRLELNGRFLRDFGKDFSDISLWPGLDINITEHIGVRPQAMFQLNSDAMTWGGGLGIFGDFNVF
jgi:hypothetical protein